MNLDQIKRHASTLFPRVIQFDLKYIYKKKEKAENETELPSHETDSNSYKRNWFKLKSLNALSYLFDLNWWLDYTPYWSSKAAKVLTVILIIGSHGVKEDQRCSLDSCCASRMVRDVS